MHMVSELAPQPVSQDTLLGYTWSFTRGGDLARARDLARAAIVGANMAGADLAGVNMAGSISQQARASSVRGTSGVSGSGFLRV